MLVQRGFARLWLTKVRFVVGTATCGLAKGALDTRDVLRKAIRKSRLDAEFSLDAVACGLGRTFQVPVITTLKHFRSDYDRLITKGSGG